MPGRVAQLRLLDGHAWKREPCLREVTVSARWACAYFRMHAPEKCVGPSPEYARARWSSSRSVLDRQIERFVQQTIDEAYRVLDDLGTL